MKRYLWAVLAITLLVPSAPLVVAQTTTSGAAVGTVSDPSGAVVAGATVTLRNLATNATRQVVTDNRGDYLVEFLNPGQYAISVSQTGFQTLTVDQVTVNVGQTLRNDIHLHLGAAAETITVSTSAPSINTENGTRGLVIQSNEISNLPLNGRNFLQLIDLAPGAVPGLTKDGAVGTSFNGARSTSNSFHIDGANSTDPEQNTLASGPPLDGIQEFQIETNSYSARYGDAGGAVVSVVTKSGTNQFHGSLYEYHRDKSLDALPWGFNGTRHDAANYLFNQFGGSVGGPIRKNKTFFFTNLEYLRALEPASRSLTFSPTDDERAGDFSHSLSPFTGEPVILTDPYTGDVIPSGILPANLISPVGQKLMSLWPKPNLTGNPFLNLQLFLSGNDKSMKWLTRIDHAFSSKDQIYGTLDKETTDGIGRGDTVYGDQANLNHGYTTTAHYTHLFRSNLLNDLSFSSVRFVTGGECALRDKNYGREWGMDPSTNTILGSPWIVIFGQSLNIFSLGGCASSDHQNHSLEFQDNLTFVKGAHALKFGGGFRRQNYNWRFFAGVQQPNIGLLDGDPTITDVFGVTGSPYADLLAALPNLNIYTGGKGDYARFQRDGWSAYVQDDWRVTPRLVLNLGLRWDYLSPFSETDNEYETLDFKTGLPILAKGAPGIEDVSFPHETGGPNRSHTPNYHDFAPRFGLAWRPMGNGNTVVRAGYGIFFSAEDANTMEQGNYLNPWGGSTVQFPKAFFWPDGEDHYNTLDQPPYQMAQLEGSTPGQAQYSAPHYPTTYVEQWNLTLGHSLGSRTGMELAYVGSQSINLNTQILLRTLDPALYLKVNTFNPNWGPIINAKGFNANYHALQASLRRTMSRGLAFNANYTYSHALTDASSDALSENIQPEFRLDSVADGLTSVRVRSNADFDLRHHLSLSGEYELPFGGGRHFGSGWRGPVDKLLGGWNLNYIYIFQTGFPYSVFDDAHNYPDQTCSGKIAHPTASQWFDFNCFPNHIPSTAIINGVETPVDIQGDARPNIIYGPHSNSLDFGVHKLIGIREGMNLEFRAEAFNALNKVSLLSPNGNNFLNNADGAQVTNARSMREVQFALRLQF